jgi:hypothetical protein
MSGPFKMKGPSLYTNSPIKNKKKTGLTIFGKSPKEFVVEGLKQKSGYNTAKNIIEKISGSKTKVSKKKK